MAAGIRTPREDCRHPRLTRTTCSMSTGSPLRGTNRAWSAVMVSVPCDLCRQAIHEGRGGTAWNTTWKVSLTQPPEIRRGKATRPSGDRTGMPAIQPTTDPISQSVQNGGPRTSSSQRRNYHALQVTFDNLTPFQRLATRGERM